MGKVTLYGITNCDTVRKVRRYLKQAGLSHQFVDLREQAPSEARLSSWLSAFGDTLVNKRSTTYREHKAEVVNALEQGESALIAVLQKYPTLIKRPVTEVDDQPYALGWEEERLAALSALQA